MRLLITGGCGFLGSNLAAGAIHRGCELTVLDNLSRLGSVSNLEWLRQHGDFRFVEADVRDADAIDRAVAELRPEAIFHLAGQVAMTTSIADPRLDFEVNAEGAFNMLDAARRNASDAIVVFSSSNKVYGDLEWVTYDEQPTRYVAVDFAEGFDESTPFAPSSPYGISKATADLYMQEFARLYGLRTVVFRHSSLYGGRQFATYEQGWVGWFCKQALEKRRNPRSRFTVAGSGKQVRDVLHARDVERLYFGAVDGIAAVQGRVFNVGGGMANSLSIVELLALLSELVGVPLPFEPIEARRGDQRVFVANNRSVSEALDWSPETQRSQGIRETLEWLETMS